MTTAEAIYRAVVALCVTAVVLRFMSTVFAPLATRWAAEDPTEDENEDSE